MMTTLNDMTAKKRPEPSAEEIAARELVRLAKEQGLSLTGPDGLLKQFTKSVLETALNEEMPEHLGHEKNRAPGARDSANVRTGTRAKTVLTHATGEVALQGSGGSGLHPGGPGHPVGGGMSTSRLGRGGCTSPSSSTPSHAGSWAGARGPACPPSWSWTPWSRRCGPVNARVRT
jgi:hypothetical protein